MGETTFFNFLQEETKPFVYLFLRFPNIVKHTNYSLDNPLTPTILLLFHPVLHHLIDIHFETHEKVEKKYVIISDMLYFIQE